MGRKIGKKVPKFGFPRHYVAEPGEPLSPISINFTPPKNNDIKKYFCCISTLIIPLKKRIKYPNLPFLYDCVFVP